MGEAGPITAGRVLATAVATWPRRIGIVLIVLVPVLVAVGGGLATAQPPPSTAEPGEVLDTGAYLTVPHYYFVSDRVDAIGLDDGERWLGAVVEITNQGSEPISVTFSDDTFELPAAVPNNDGVNPYEVLRLDTGSYLGDAQPGISYDVALLWRTTGLTEPPPELPFIINQTAWTEWSIEPGYQTWRTTGDSDEVLLPLGEAPASILEDEEDE